jgi:iron complex outermembrane receptor protein
MTYDTGRRTVAFARLLAACAAIAAPLAAPAAARAQLPAPAPQVSGRVADPDGRPLPNAQVFIASINRGTLTDGEGRYILRAVPPGSYHLDVQLIGFRRVHRELTVAAGAGDLQVDFVLVPTPLQLGDVVATATPIGGESQDIAQSTVALSDKELARNIGAGIAQTLEAQPGLATRYSGPLAAMPVIRGLTGDRILVLQNGGRTGDLSSSAPDHAVSLDPLNAERIEVVRGPASLLYGSSALGGVVNVITSDIPSSVPERVGGWVAAQGGTANPGGAASAALTVPLGDRFAARAGASLRDLGDTRVGGGATLDNTDATSRSGVAGLGFVSAHAMAGLSAEIYEFEYGIAAEPDDPEAGIRLDGDRRQLTARAERSFDDGVLGSLRFDGTVQHYRHVELEPDGAVGTRFDLRTQTAGALARTALGRVAGAIGVQGFFKQYEPTGEEAFTPGADHSNVGVFLFEDIPFGDLADTSRAVHLQLGARYDYYRVESADAPAPFGPSRSRTFSNVSGSAGLVIPLSRSVSFNANVASAFRAPTVEELFANGFHAAVGTFDIGDPDLDRETNNGAEAVLHVDARRTHAQLSSYFNRIEGYVFPRVVGTTTNEDGEEVPLVNIAQSDATLAGIEGSVETEAGRHFVVGFMGDLVRGSFDESGDPLPFMPPARVGASVRWDDGRWSLSGRVRHALEQDRVTGDALDVATPAYTLVDLSAGYSLILGGQVHTITLRADNLLDERYFDATSRIKRFAPNPGRDIALVYKVLF